MPAAFVQAFSAITSAAAANLTTGAVTIGAGNTVCIGWFVEGAKTFGSMASSMGDTIGLTGTDLSSGGTSTGGVRIIQSAIGGSTTFTLNCSGGSTQLQMSGIEFSGASGLVDQYGTLFGTGFVTAHSGGTTNGGPATPGAVLAGDAIFVYVNDAGPPPASESYSAPPAGYTIPAAGTAIGTASTSFPGFVAYAINVSAGVQTFTYTSAKFVQSAGIIFGLPAPSSGIARGGGNLDGGLNGGFL